MPRINRLEVQGFRAFGAKPQVLDLQGPLAVLWGPNSRGKTSLAEAIEFLLTGRTVRRDFVASATREFSGSLRNAHLSAGTDVIVKAEIVDADGEPHSVERVLTADYTGRDSCTSELRIDGAAAQDLSALGVRLSQPPLEAPILMQHTLRYVVSAKPQDRAVYFKALLEVSDLESVRTAVDHSRSALDAPPPPLLATLQRCVAHDFAQSLRPLQTISPLQQAELDGAISEALALILHDQDIPDGLENRTRAVADLLGTRRQATFPTSSFQFGAAPSWTPPAEQSWQDLARFIELRRGVDREVARLTAVFTAVLDIPSVAQAHEPVDCPVCETPGALTPERVDAIRRHLQAQEQYQAARRRAQTALQQLRQFRDHVERSVLAARPVFLSWNDDERRRRSFTEEAIRTLLGAEADELVPPWHDPQGPLVEALAGVTTEATRYRQLLDQIVLDDLDEEATDELQTLQRNLIRAGELASQRLDELRAPQQPLVAALNREIDRRGQTEGWQDLLSLAEGRAALRTALIEQRARQIVRRELEDAIRALDQANASVLDEKFADLSDEITVWWDLLRPSEPTSFAGVRRGASGRRYIDLKARLSTDPNDTSGGVLRDVVAVFSDSQLNCLGLSAFLARATREATGFVILDDPVLASDDEHRAMFIHRVIQQLLDQSYQVIVITYDQDTWKDIQDAYHHLSLDTFLITLDEPARGAIVENRSDTLDALIARSVPYIYNNDPSIRKMGCERLRNAAERFCKLLLIKERRSNGEDSASLSDYDGKNLGDLLGDVYPLLTADPSHPGKLRVIGRRLNPGTHDDTVPAAGDLRVCHGDLRQLRRTYL